MVEEHPEQVFWEAGGAAGPGKGRESLLPRSHSFYWASWVVSSSEPHPGTCLGSHPEHRSVSLK